MFASMSNGIYCCLKGYDFGCRYTLSIHIKTEVYFGLIQEHMLSIFNAGRSIISEESYPFVFPLIEMLFACLVSLTCILLLLLMDGPVTLIEPITRAVNYFIHKNFNTF